MDKRFIHTTGHNKHSERHLEENKHLEIGHITLHTLWKSNSNKTPVLRWEHHFHCFCKWQGCPFFPAAQAFYPSLASRLHRLRQTISQRVTHCHYGGPRSSRGQESRINFPSCLCIQPAGEERPFTLKCHYMKPWTRLFYLPSLLAVTLALIVPSVWFGWFCHVHTYDKMCCDRLWQHFMALVLIQAGRNGFSFFF